MPKVILDGYIVVPENDLALVMAELPTHIQLTRREEGGLYFYVTQNPHEQNTFAVYEEFVDRVAFDAHQRRVHASNWGRAAANVARHYKVIETNE
jgi:autoinducer 2-degrading protein